MCGIVGIYNLAVRNENFPRSILEKMTNSLSHRGPDDAGFYIDTKIALGHRRLAILDLSKKGWQPMTDAKKGVFVVFNGEIYNFKEIRKTLMEKGYPFKSKSDTEVIVYSYLEWGIKCLDLFNGEFGLAIYDKLRGRLYVARDRLGIKPLYYALIDNRLIFASEIKAILRYPGYNQKLNYKAVSSYLSYRYPLGKETFFEGIYSLEPGCLLKVTNIVEKERYWNLRLDKRTKDRGEDYYLKKIKELLENSVKKRMISDVPLGAYLSGGLDSSAVVAIMSKHSPTPIKTFTIGFEEEGYNEFYYARLVAEKHHTLHQEITLSSQKYLKTTKELIKFKDAPLGVPNEVPLYLMSKELKKHITVVLSGEGADEIFGGYGRLFRSPFDYYRMKILGPIPFVQKFPFINTACKNLTKKYGRLKFKNKLDHFLSQYTYFPFNEKFGLFSENTKSRIEDDSWLFNLFRENFNRTKASYCRKIAYLFEKMHLPGLLQRVDICTMSNSVEARVPFVDHELVEFMINVPIKYKMKWRSKKNFLEALSLNSDQISENKDITKYILKKLMGTDLPEEVINRRKKGFPVPLDIWFRKDFVELAKKELLSDKAKIKEIFDRKKLTDWIALKDSKDFGQKLWMILNLEYFLREYF